ncbi:hypothetical protein pb186bvf_011733 [Paramecium bursaria]
MNHKNIDLSTQIVDRSFILLAQNSINARENILTNLLSQRQLPEEGLDDLTIEYLMNQFAIMDTNNFINKIGVGERESRIYSQIIQKRYFYMGHGIGRSGDVDSTQPKAAGSSLIAKLTKYLVKDALRVCNYQINSLIVLPLATGMALTQCLLTLKSIKPQAKYILWTRIDQKTCLKCIQTANLIPIVIPNIEGSPIVTTNIDVLLQKIEELNPENILCVLSTTSCFAPRVPDNIPELAKVCKQNNLFHVVNNAYGLQCNKIANLINTGLAAGNVDFIVSSTDKNFMVPVGGSIIYGNNEQLIKKISENYPGRASSAPIVDIFITLLSMGRSGLQELLKQRVENFAYFKQELQKLTQQLNEEVVETKLNGISMAITLKNKQFIQVEKNEATQLGAKLYVKKIMGARVVTNKKPKIVGGIEFQNYGSHCGISIYQIQDQYFAPYLTVACAIGMTRKEIDKFLIKFKESY